MCGRYVLRLRPSEVRQRLEDQDMTVEEAPDDDNGQLRQTYNFAPGYHGLIYRAQTSTHGSEQGDGGDGEEPSRKKVKLQDSPSNKSRPDGRATSETKFKLQAAKWGLIPFWTKRSPDFGSQMRTINCRDDSLIENRGMWNTMKQRKRCIVLAEGFYEWKKENNGKTKLPHYIKRKDGELMCFAGLWDMVQYEGSDEQLYTYTIITTDSNKQLKFLHDRMPVILEAASEEMKQWLDPSNVGWSKELQSMLKPFSGELECYPVDKAVGKVGNNSPTFVVPLDSKENKSNIANFFDTQRATTESGSTAKGADIRGDQEDGRKTTDNVQRSEDNAPLPEPPDESNDDLDKRIEKDITELSDEALAEAADKSNSKITSASPEVSSSSKKAPTSGKRKRDPTSNGTVPRTPTKKGNMRITNFYI